MNVVIKKNICDSSQNPCELKKHILAFFKSLERFSTTRASDIFNKHCQHRLLQRLGLREVWADAQRRPLEGNAQLTILQVLMFSKHLVVTQKSMKEEIPWHAQSQ